MAEVPKENPRDWVEAARALVGALSPKIRAGVGAVVVAIVVAVDTGVLKLNAAELGAGDPKMEPK